MSRSASSSAAWQRPDGGFAAALEEIRAGDRTTAACHTWMHIMGGNPRYGSDAQKAKWREARLCQAAPISTNMILACISEHVLGLPRSY